MSELILVPTPISDDLPLETVARERLLEDALKEDVVLLVEEHKVGRQRWLKWGLPREAIEKFQLFNEHTQEKMRPDIVKLLKSGKRVYLLSDCGLPAFCDPGQHLVDACHKQGIKVTSTPFPNSIALAVALSGFSHDRFSFCGFVPVKDPERTDWMKRELKKNETLVWMETPYRLKKLVEELSKLNSNREIFLGMDLGNPAETLLRGTPGSVMKRLGETEKREFVLVIGPIS
ncbi:SAM-dependent methyltransferase [Peredibacter starrii]|uniref:SAM-dependent methyltransferase n=1 Tax=Peredibacter starrii TaxID=28202 RepID=A0AAX4HIS5_9BACT|nr:SAM-dependent methyltransferase [Peredibacter starrii]WPU63141.1 SAM-dependent methyltransferase [Peredibacter starrii]